METLNSARPLEGRWLLALGLAVILFVAAGFSGAAYAQTVDYWELKIGEEHLAYVANQELAENYIEMIKADLAGEYDDKTVVTVKPGLKAEKFTLEKNEEDNYEVIGKPADDMAALLSAKVNQLSPEITVERFVEREIPIPFDTEYVEDPSLAEGVKVTRQQGKKGVSVTTDWIIEVNGQVVSRETVSTKIVEEPVTKIIASATPKGSYFIWPHEDIITSYFGYRNDAPGTTNHQGIDINANQGDPVVAARAGTVMSDTGWAEGYGNLVCIDHGDGMVSMYAHNSQILVKVGDKVEVGQVIAKAGSTGWSSGAHVHFEVHKDGTAVNPLEYLPANNYWEGKTL